MAPGAQGLGRVLPRGRVAARHGLLSSVREHQGHLGPHRLPRGVVGDSAADALLRLARHPQERLPVGLPERSELRGRALRVVDPRVALDVRERDHDVGDLVREVEEVGHVAILGPALAPAGAACDSISRDSTEGGGAVRARREARAEVRERQEQRSRGAERGKHCGKKIHEEGRGG